MTNRRWFLVWLVTLLLVVLLIDVVGIWLLRRHAVFFRLVPVSNLGDIAIPYNPDGLAELATDFQGDSPQILLSQVMNSVQTIEPYSNKNVLNLYSYVKNGGGTICGGMALLYWNALQLNGIPARIIELRRSIYGIYDLHTSVEVLIEGQWIIYDPTFNISFQRNGELLGAQQIKEALHDGSFEQIEPVFYGEVTYPARLEDYYMHWLPLFDNVFVIYNPPNTSFWAKIPPFRYWYGARYYYQPITDQQIFRHQFQDNLYFATVVILPVTIFILTVIIIFVIGSMIYSRQKHVPAGRNQVKIFGNYGSRA